MARNVPRGKRMSPVLRLMVPPAVNGPHAMALARLPVADSATNWKCSILLLIVLALAAVTLVPAITAARESVPAAAPRSLRMMPPVISAADCAGTLARAWERGRYFDCHCAQLINQGAAISPNTAHPFIWVNGPSKSTQVVTVRLL